MESFAADIIESKVVRIFLDDNVIDAVFGAGIKVIVKEGHSFCDFDKTKDAGGGKSETKDI